MTFEFVSGEIIPVERCRMLAAIFDRVTTEVTVVTLPGEPMRIRFHLGYQDPRRQGATAARETSP